MAGERTVCVMSGSPHANGACERLVSAACEAIAAAGANPEPVLLSGYRIRECLGCGACAATGECVLDARAGAAGCDAAACAAGGGAGIASDSPADGDRIGLMAPVASPVAGAGAHIVGTASPARPAGTGAHAIATASHARPGFLEAYAALARADALLLVTPVYFAGPPARLKALFDRMQFLWAQRYVLHVRPALPMESRRPFDLVVVGGGGDPFGYEPLTTCARSALRMADYELRQVCDCVGYRMGDAAFDAACERRVEEAARLLAVG